MGRDADVILVNSTGFDDGLMASVGRRRCGSPCFDRKKPVAYSMGYYGLLSMHYGLRSMNYGLL